jgi:hypothetical protein
MCDEEDVAPRSLRNNEECDEEDVAPIMRGLRGPPPDPSGRRAVPDASLRDGQRPRDCEWVADRGGGRW